MKTKQDVLREMRQDLVNQITYQREYFGNVPVELIEEYDRINEMIFGKELYEKIQQDCSELVESMKEEA